MREPRATRPKSSAWREIRERFQYRLDDIFARGSTAHFVLILLFALFVVCVGMSAYWLGLFAPENAGVEGIERRIDEGFWDTLWWSMKHVFDPAFFDLNHGATLPVILVSLLVSILGMVLFAILIGFMASDIEGRMQALRKGNSIVKEKGHVLLLGWSNKVPAILRLLALSRRGVRVVVLAPRDVEDMQERLRLEGIDKLPVKVILRNGCTSDPGELERMAFDSAFSIIVLAYDTDAHGVGDPNIEAIKTLMHLSSFEDWQGARPKMVCEVSENQKREIALIAGKRTIPVVSSGQIVSKVLVQCARQSGLSSVYEEIFSFAGNTIYVKDVPACAGATFEAAARGFPRAVLLGVSRLTRANGHVAYVPVLGPGREYVIQPGEWLILLTGQRTVEYGKPYAEPVVRAVDTPAPAPRPLENVLIIGWNGNLYDIVCEFDEYASGGGRLEILSDHDGNQAQALLADHVVRPLRNLMVSYRRGNSINRTVLESLNVARFDCIMVLADDSHGEIDPDARTIMLLVLLEDIRAAAGLAGPRVVVEILDPRNRALLRDAGVSDVVVSPEVASMLLTQISQQQMLTTVYDDLLNSRGNEIYLKPATHYAPLGVSTSFAELSSAALRHGEIALGVRVADASASGNGPARTLLNPERELRWSCGEDDRLIVLAQDLYS